jgi:dihydroneopterin aldolase
MDIVFIEELRVEAVIGIYGWERDLRQPLLLSLELGFDNRRPAASGDVAEAVDYATVTAALREWVAASSYGLLEQLAEDCCTMLAGRFGVRMVSLRVDKPLAAMNLGCTHVGIRIERRFD